MAVLIFLLQLGANLVIQVHLLVMKSQIIGKIHHNTKNTDSKPLIFVSGDDAGNYFVESASSQDPNDWTYSTSLIYEQRSGTVGAFSICDINDDGYVEVFMAVYEQSFVRVMSY